MSCFTKEQLSKISDLVKEIEQLSDIEKLLLYLQLPCGQVELSEAGKFKSNGKHNFDLLSKKPDQETTQTYTWILSHLEEDPSVSLPKQEVYDEYKSFCQTNNIEPLCVADFGKAMKHAFPCIKPRRLGQRGNSKYCYSGLRKKFKLQPPSLPDLIETNNYSYSDNNNFQHLPPTTSSQQHQNLSHQTLDAHNLHQQQLGELAAATHLVSLNNHSNNNSHHPHHQQQQINYSCCEAMNLKIEPPDSHQPPQQHQHPQHAHPQQASIGHNSHHQQNLSMPLQHPCNNDNGPYQTIQSQSTPSSSLDQQQIKTERNNDNMTQDGGNGSLPTPVESTTDTQPHLDGQPLAGSNNLMDQHQQQQQQIPFALTQSSASHIRPNYEYSCASQRFGTPDDDDYNHNYQDLNRPIVGDVFHFTQQRSSESRSGANGNVFLYESTQNSNTNLSQHHHHQTDIHHNSIGLPTPNHLQHQSTVQPQHHDHNQSQHHIPTSPTNKSSHHHAARLRLSLNLPPINNPCATNHAVTPSSTPLTGSPTQNPQHQTSQLTGGLDSHSEQNRNQQYHTNGGNGNNSTCNYNVNSNPHNLHLSNVCAISGTNSCYSNRMNNSSLDCCASPFQSPASTPYPMMGNFSTQDVNSYYSNDCIGYSDH